MVNAVPILQQFYASKYAGVATLTFDDTGSLTAATGQSVPLGTYYTDAGVKMTGAHSQTRCALAICPLAVEHCIHVSRKTKEKIKTLTSSRSQRVCPARRGGNLPKTMWAWSPQQYARQWCGAYALMAGLLTWQVVQWRRTLRLWRCWKVASKMS